MNVGYSCEKLLCTRTGTVAVYRIPNTFYFILSIRSVDPCLLCVELFNFVFMTLFTVENFRSFLLIQKKMKHRMDVIRDKSHILKMQINSVYVCNLAKNIHFADLFQVLILFVVSLGVFCLCNGK
jgi:hypothetical protein